MLPRFVGRLGIADAVTIANAALGFVAVVVAFVDINLAARLILLAAVADGLDGLLARRYGGTDAGPYLDSLADVASFAVAPAALAFVVVTDGLGIPLESVSAELLLVSAICALFVAMAVARLGMYTAYDTADDYTEGVQTTLAATVIGAAILAGVADPWLVLAVTGAFCYLMVSRIPYPDLLARDAGIMGVIHVLAILIPNFAGRTFPYALLTLGIAYMTLSPWFYWRDREDAGSQTTTTHGNA
ncbi:putative archaetidylserine synthase [Natrialba magadii ATCC 43099]|uniref:Archaetidylserine synthase n=1 Tax=Natrialba magadii (strain ATCC 43099 / DSM 3394 / CCM 3739 / CIP 104546 / IAM 13178 / JCM 8861 / NBRC 102185 / NCIMB 2190 / MS3) TaxID=547559 RepID=D3SXN7_NATMM|nr:protein sorting system archaetidylserine synthase [Natrialba magadii]ADD05986.1 putative archaetidylserine synthase [Natrialba magadii ATCC 43099]ELY30505.1 CDP-alcohol phosphatidyltransferase [Natrialba magadii ATCC 43099]